MSDSVKANRKQPRSKGTKPAEIDELIQAINHPLRRQILRYLHSSRKPLSPKQIERKLNLSELRSGVLSSVSYHVGVLRDFKTITLVGKAQRRGAVEHFYKSAVSNTAWIRSLLKKTSERDQRLLWDQQAALEDKSVGQGGSENSG